MIPSSEVVFQVSRVQLTHPTEQQTPLSLTQLNYRDGLDLGP